MGIVIAIVVIALLVVIIAGLWKTFEKAGQPGWGCLIPIYNYYLMCKIGGRPGWWVILMLLPYINIVFIVIVSIDIAKSFGKGVGYGFGLGFLGFIFYPMLGFGEAEYQGPAAA